MLLGLATVLTVTTALAVATRWDTIGQGAFVVTTSILAAVMCLGPLRHRPRRRRVVLLPSLAGAAMLSSVLVEIAGLVVDLDLGPLRVPDVFLFTAYGCLGLWIVTLARSARTPGRAIVALDTAATVLGVVLTLWSLALGAIVGGAGVAKALVIAAYPTIDVLLLSLAVHVAVPARTIPRPMRLLLGTLALLLVLDLGNAVITLRTGAPSLLLFSGQLFVSLGFAAAATHPQLPRLWTPDDHGDATGTRRPALLLLTLAPVPLAILLPARSAGDMAVRGLLALTLIGVLTARMWRTIGDLATAEADSRHRATHDALTGLPNRAAFLSLLETRLRRDARARTDTAVLFLDLDRFKDVNDTFGHHAGDTLLRHVATVTPTALRADDVVARLAGDEFVAVASVQQAQQAVAIAERILEQFTTPVRITPDHLHRITPSIGIALAHPGDGSTPHSLLTRADAAMYRAKHSGRGRWALDG